MKKLFTLTIMSMMLLSLTGCESKKEIEDTNTKVDQITIEASDTSILDDLHTLSSLENKTVTVKLLSSAMLDESGIPMLDDSNDFAVVASIGDKDYVLLEKQMIQLGEPKVSLFEDVDGSIVITITDIRTSKYDIFECTYDEKLEVFSVIYLTQHEDINFLGEI